MPRVANCPTGSTTCCLRTASRSRRPHPMVDAATSSRAATTTPPTRPEYLRDTVAGSGIGVVQKPLTVWQRLAQQGWLRKALILTLIALAWELYARRLNNPLLVPTFSATVEAFWAGIRSGDILIKVSNSVQLLLKGYALGLTLAMVFTALAMRSEERRVGKECRSRSAG